MNGSSLQAPSPRFSSVNSLRGGHCNERSEEHTSELQSHLNLVCRLLLEKKKNSLRKHLVSARLAPIWLIICVCRSSVRGIHREFAPTIGTFSARCQVTNVEAPPITVHRA